MSMFGSISNSRRFVYTAPVRSLILCATLFTSAICTAASIEAVPAKPLIKDNRVRQVAVKIKGSAKERAKLVKFFVSNDNEKYAESSAEVADGFAAVDTDGVNVRWFALVKGSRGETLASVGNAGRPIVANAEPPATDSPKIEVVQRPSEPAPPPSRPRLKEPEDPLENEARTSRLLQTTVMKSKYPALKPVGWILLGAGAASLGTGIYFGFHSQEVRNKLKNVTVDDQGRVISTTEKAAQNMQTDMVNSAYAANFLYGFAGAFAVASVVCLIVGRDVPVSVSPNGVTVSGRF